VEIVHSKLVTVAYFKQILASMREISDEAPAPGTLPMAAVGLGAAPTEVSSAQEAVQRQLDGGGLLCTWLGHRAVPLYRLGVLSRA
jgi:hypothetical protein